MLKETFIGSIVLIGVWLFNNWFKLVTTILLIIICSNLIGLNTLLNANIDDMDFQLGGIRSIDSDIRDNTDGIKSSISEMDYHVQYPSIIR